MACGAVLRLGARVPGRGFGLGAAARDVRQAAGRASGAAPQAGRDGHAHRGDPLSARGPDRAPAGPNRRAQTGGGSPPRGGQSADALRGEGRGEGGGGGGGGVVVVGGAGGLVFFFFPPPRGGGGGGGGGAWGCAAVACPHPNPP